MDMTYANASVYLLPIGERVAIGGGKQGEIAGYTIAIGDWQPARVQYTVRMDTDHRGYLGLRANDPSDGTAIFISTIVADIGSVEPIEKEIRWMGSGSIGWKEPPAEEGDGR